MPFATPVFILVMVILCQSGFSQYKEGYYYTKDGVKVEGLLRLEYGDHMFRSKDNGDCFISFKEKRGERKARLTAADICCFVIEKDSFAVIKNFALNFMVFYPRDFAQVLQDGKIKLYLYYSVVSNGSSNGLMYSRTVKEWVVEKGGIWRNSQKRRLKN